MASTSFWVHERSNGHEAVCRSRSWAATTREIRYGWGYEDNDLRIREEHTRDKK